MGAQQQIETMIWNLEQNCPLPDRPTLLRVLKDVQTSMTSSPIHSRGTVTSTERLHGVIGKLRAHIGAIQAAKADVDAGRDAPEINPILVCINDLPVIVRELDMAELEIEADFEAHEDRQSLFPVEAGDDETERLRDALETTMWRWKALDTNDTETAVRAFALESVRLIAAASPPLAEGQDHE